MATTEPKKVRIVVYTSHVVQWLLRLILWIDLKGVLYHGRCVHIAHGAMIASVEGTGRVEKASPPWYMYTYALWWCWKETFLRARSLILKIIYTTLNISEHARVNICHLEIVVFIVIKEIIVV